MIIPFLHMHDSPEDLWELHMCKADFDVKCLSPHLKRYKWPWNEWPDSLELYSATRIVANLYFVVKNCESFSLNVIFDCCMSYSLEHWFESYLFFFRQVKTYWILESTYLSILLPSYGIMKAVLHFKRNIVM